MNVQKKIHFLNFRKLTIVNTKVKFEISVPKISKITKSNFVKKLPKSYVFHNPTPVTLLILNVF